MSAWKPGANGVMMFVPREVELSTTCSLSQLSVGGGPYRAPLNDEREFQSAVQSEPIDEPSFSRLSSPSTLSAGSQNEISSPSNSSDDAPPTTSSDDAFFQELKTFAALAEQSSPSIHPTPTSSLAYDSDRTDFLPYELTPCPRRKEDVLRRKRVRTSHYFVANAQNKPKPIRRRLSFWGTPSSNRVETRKPAKPKRPPLPEYSPPRKWSYKEEELLCTLYRWFERAPKEFALVFNEIFSLDVPVKKIKDRFETHLALYGPRAHLALKKVFVEVTFEDPGGVYRGIRHTIDAIARMLGVQLRRLRTETKFRFGWATQARSAVTRETYKKLVRKASELEKYEKAQAHTEHDLSALVPSPRSRAVSIDADSAESSLNENNRSGIVSADSAISIESSLRTPHLAFRVWDEHSWSIQKEDGAIYAHLFAQRRSPPTRPLPRNDEFGLFDVLANAHLSKQGGASPFVSVVTSLLQAIKYASTMSSPKLAMIDLSALREESERVHYAAPIIASLKRSREMTFFTRYSGQCEYLVWGYLPKDAILHVFPLDELRVLANADLSVSKLLYLEFFAEHSNTPSVSQRIKEQNSILNIRTSQAIGRIAKVYGLDKANFSASHIQDFVCALCDGWSIRAMQDYDMHTKTSIAESFAITLRSRSCHLQDCMAAFLEGIDCAAQSNAQFSHRNKKTL